MLSSRIGILGGGQLGLMLLQAAVDWNLDIHVLDPDAEAPCRKIAPHFTQGSLQDFDTVYSFGKDLDVITIEIEKVNVEALEALEKEGKKVYPQPSVIRQIQDKRIQKQFYAEKQLPTAEFILTEDRQDVANHISFLPAFHKLGKDGYDGRGVQRLTSAQDLEKAVAFEKELAVIVARNAKGELETFPTVEMVFHPEHNLVEYLFAPAEISEEINAKAQAIARQTAEAFQIVGLLAVELFLTDSGEVLINEVAPRPHNSGHHTIRANATSQYEQHWRAILNLPLGSTHAYGPSAMVNLLGEDGYEGPAVYEGMEKLLATPQVFPFLYWKALTKPFRKMGHITIMDADIASLKAKADFVRNNIKVISHKTK